MEEAGGGNVCYRNEIRTIREKHDQPGDALGRVDKTGGDRS